MKKPEFSYDDNQQIENMNLHQRMKRGHWVDGESYKEESKATMSEANSDHGKFDSAIEKKNA
jgi:hypothetical protein